MLFYVHRHRHIMDLQSINQGFYSGLSNPEPKKRVWRHGRAWKMKVRAWKNQNPCFNFYKHIYALLNKYPV